MLTQIYGATRPQWVLVDFDLNCPMSVLWLLWPKLDNQFDRRWQICNNWGHHLPRSIFIVGDIYGIGHGVVISWKRFPHHWPFRITGPLQEESINRTRQKEPLILCSFFTSQSKLLAKITIDLPMIWDAMGVMWRWRNENKKPRCVSATFSSKKFYTFM